MIKKYGGRPYSPGFRTIDGVRMQSDYVFSYNGEDAYETEHFPVIKAKPLPLAHQERKINEYMSHVMWQSILGSED